MDFREKVARITAPAGEKKKKKEKKKVPSVDFKRASFPLSFHFTRYGQVGQQQRRRRRRHGAIHGLGGSALAVRPLLCHPLQRHLPGRGGRLGGRRAAQRQQLHGGARSRAERGGARHRHLHHGSLLGHLRGGTPGQRPGHVRGGEVKRCFFISARRRVESLVAFQLEAKYLMI